MRDYVLVVGAGLAGATTARVLAESGFRVIVVERRRHVGGNCYDRIDENGITIHLYGPHIFHTNIGEVWNFVNRFAEFRYYQHRVLSFVEGRFVPFPINRDTICEVFGVNIGTEEVETFLKDEVRRSKFNDPPKNFRDVVVSQVGERLYELFFKNYTLKQWNRDPEELAPDVAKRIPVRYGRDDRYFSDRYQGIPARGYTHMVENMLDHPGISVVTNMDYFELRDHVKPRLTVYTGELDRFFDYAHGKLEYRSLKLLFRTYDVEYYQPAAVVNYPNDYDWTRITEFKHMTGEKSPRTTVLFEYPCSEGEPFYVVLTHDNMERRRKYMEEVEKLERTGEYIFVGRLAEYLYYNMDQVVEASIRKIRGWLENRKDR